MRSEVGRGGAERGGDLLGENLGSERGLGRGQID